MFSDPITAPPKADIMDSFFDDLKTATNWSVAGPILGPKPQRAVNTAAAALKFVASKELLPVLTFSENAEKAEAIAYSGGIVLSKIKLVQKFIKGIVQVRESIKEKDLMKGLLAGISKVLSATLTFAKILTKNTARCLQCIAGKIQMSAENLEKSLKACKIAGGVLAYVAKCVSIIPKVINTVFAFGLYGELNRNVIDGDKVYDIPRLKNLLKRQQVIDDNEQLTFLESILYPALTPAELEYMNSLGFGENQEVNKVTFLKEAIVTATRKNYHRLINDSIAKKTIKRVFKSLSLDHLQLSKKGLKGLTVEEVDQANKLLLEKASYTLVKTAISTAGLGLMILSSFIAPGSAIAIAGSVAGLGFSAFWLTGDVVGFVDTFDGVKSDNRNVIETVLNSSLVVTSIAAVIGSIVFTVIVGVGPVALPFVIAACALGAIGAIFPAALVAKEGVLKFNQEKAKKLIEEHSDETVYTEGQIKRDAAVIDMYVRNSTKENLEIEELKALIAAYRSTVEDDKIDSLQAYLKEVEDSRQLSISKTQKIILLQKRARGYLVRKQPTPS